jgi:hypothetical protein
LNWNNDYSKGKLLITRTTCVFRKHVDTETGCIEEHVFGFIAVQEATAAALTDTIFRKLQILGLDINYCRCQNYDNEANMAGVTAGVITSHQSKSFLYSVLLSQFESAVRRCRQIVKNGNQLFFG